MAEDRSAPDVTDAGWDLDLDVPLHSALIAVGILAGTFERLPWGAESAAEHYEFRTFSRLVLGALEAKRRSLTGSSRRPSHSPAQDRSTRRGILELESEAAHRLLAEALTYILEARLRDSLLQRPRAITIPAPAQPDRFQHLMAFFRFLGFGLLLLHRAQGRARGRRPLQVRLRRPRLQRRQADAGRSTGASRSPTSTRWTPKQPRRPARTSQHSIVNYDAIRRCRPHVSGAPSCAW